MSYDGIIMQRAIARFDQARQRREAELDQRRREVFARQPRLRDIDRTLRTTMSRIVAAAAKKGEDPLPALRVLRDENLSLQRERATLLEDMGYPADYLEDKPACPLCGDTGYTRSGVCACLKQYYAREQLASVAPAGGSPRCPSAVRRCPGRCRPGVRPPDRAVPGGPVEAAGPGPEGPSPPRRSAGG